MTIFDLEIDEIKVHLVDVCEECLDISSQSKFCLVGYHVACRADIMIAGMDTLIELSVHLLVTVAYPVIHGEILFIFSGNVQGRGRSNAPAQNALSKRSNRLTRDRAALATDWAIHFLTSYSQ